MESDSSSSPIPSASNNTTLRRPVVSCALTTIIAVPIWFIVDYEVHNAINSVDRPAGVPLYLLVCLIAAIPLGILNAFLIAPTVGHAINGSSKYCALVMFHIVGFCITVAVIESLWFVANTPHIPGFECTFFLLYFAEFFIPPIIVGSLVYSLRKLAAQKNV